MGVPRNVEPIENLGTAAQFIGGSDARIIMGSDEAALLRLWREKRGEVEPEDLSGNLIVQLGIVTEDLNRHWYERNTGHGHQGCPAAGPAPGDRGGWRPPWTAGRGHRGGVRSQIHAAVVVLGGSCGRKTYGPAAAQHVGDPVQARRCCRSSPAAANGSRSTIPADPLYQHLLLTAEKKFWRCVESGEAPRLFGVEPPRPRIEAVRIVDMSTIQLLGGIRRRVLPDPAGLSRSRSAPRPNSRS